METFSSGKDMRRKDREVTDFSKIIDVVAACDCFRLGLVDEDNLPYIVPLNFGYEVDDGKLVLYFHGAKVGHKAELLKHTSKVSFEMDCAHELKEAGDNASAYSYFYECVMGKGEVYELLSYDDKVRAFKVMMQKYAHRDNFTFPQKAIDSVAVYKIAVNTLTCKIHAKPNL